jgi:hypothetical protein
MKPTLIPNITIDNVIERHIQMLLAHGADGWAPGGAPHQDREERKECVPGLLDHSALVLNSWIFDLHNCVDSRTCSRRWRKKLAKTKARKAKDRVKRDEVLFHVVDESTGDVVEIAVPDPDVVSDADYVGSDEEDEGGDSERVTGHVVENRPQTRNSSRRSSNRP